MFTEPRRVLMPRRGEQFLGPNGRSRARIRERRRRVFTLLLEGIGLTGLIGLFPPLREMWWLTGILIMALGAYVWMLIQLKAQERAAPPADSGSRVVAEAEHVVEKASHRQIAQPDPMPHDIVVDGDRKIVIIRDEYAPRRPRVAG